MCSSRSRWSARWPDDTQRFLERNAKLQWGIMVCVYGMSHVPALLLLDFPGDYEGKGAFLVFFLVFVVQTCMLVQHLVTRAPEAPAQRCRRSAPASTGTAGRSAWLVGERRRRPAVLHHAVQARPGAGDGFRSPAWPARWATW